jgi:hypothetical protein
MKSATDQANRFISTGINHLVPAAVALWIITHGDRIVTGLVPFSSQSRKPMMAFVANAGGKPPTANRWMENKK